VHPRDCANSSGSRGTNDEDSSSGDVPQLGTCHGRPSRSHGIPRPLDHDHVQSLGLFRAVSRHGCIMSVMLIRRLDMLLNREDTGNKKRGYTSNGRKERERSNVKKNVSFAPIRYRQNSGNYPETMGPIRCPIAGGDSTNALSMRQSLFRDFPLAERGMKALRGEDACCDRFMRMNFEFHRRR